MLLSLNALVGKTMTNTSKPSLNDFPDELKATLQLIEKNGSNDLGVALTQFVASFVHPDMVCNLSMMDSMPDAAKAASLKFFERCLTDGLTIEQQGDLLRFIQPYIVKVLGGPLPN